ncbi:GPI ethanolamine phosphate transferase 3-like [Rhopilema esculentum]|uniref:GPI ethanolamine phosphate transferase 3-like n=1 Tax=Rhopilema esculentum TaxID=499914 RepID=UPI0031DE699C
MKAKMERRNMFVLQNLSHSSTLKSFVLILWIYSTFIFGLLVFRKGFLLTRNEMKNHSFQNWHSVDSHLGYRHNNEYRNWQTFSRLVLVVIDGLRFDFIAKSTNESTNFYHNKMKLLQSLLAKAPERTKLFKFIADPPTTTMQRLKGLTTGSLPTFVDAGSNYESGEIEEDSLLYQFHAANKTMVFMGDDTWISLYPSFFKRKFPFSSFDVKDLDTVDDGIISHMIPEVKKKDWNVLIAHFLGVDHCGHRYGPNHQEMERKLTQIDYFLRDLIQQLDNDTLLYVFGDHGMTQSGDHGGDSDDEVMSALIIHSQKTLFRSRSEKSHLNVTNVAQVDIVPTLALQMNVPIPFSNIGSIIEALFETKQDYVQGDLHKIDEYMKRTIQGIENGISVLGALHLNALQVFGYVKEYSKSSSDLPKEKVSILEEMFHSAERKFSFLSKSHREMSRKHFEREITMPILTQLLSDVLENQQDFRAFLHGIFHAYQDVWVKFNTTLMIVGIFFMAIICLVIICFSIQSRYSTKDDVKYVLFAFHLKHIVGITSSLISWLILLLRHPFQEYGITISSCFQLFSIVCLVWHQGFLELPNLWRCKFGLSFIDYSAIISVVIYTVSQFSNSYTVWENSVLLLLIQTLISTYTLSYLQKNLRSGQESRKSKRQDRKQQKQEESYKGDIAVFVFCLFMSFSLRLSMFWWSCREEQSYCKATSLLRRLDSVSYSDSSNMIQLRLAVASSCLLAVIMTAYFWCKNKGNLVGTSAVSTSIKLFTPVSGLCILLHWVLQIPGKSKLEKVMDLSWMQQVLLPRIVFLFLFISIILLIWNPLSLHAVFRGGHSSHGNMLFSESSLEQNIHAVYKELKESFGDDKKNISQKDDYKPPIVFGMKDVYTSAYVAVLAPVVLFLMLLLGDGLAASVLLMVVSAVCLLWLPEIKRPLREGPSTFKLVAWALVTSYWFFGTGHQATIPSIRFDAAFVGLQGDIGIYIPGILVLFNQFSSAVFFSASLPLLCVWSARADEENRKEAPNDDCNNIGEMRLHDDPSTSERLMLQTVLACILASMLKVTVQACVASLHRRHLMVWKIFGPRFLFEAVSSVFSIPFLILGYIYFTRIHQTLQTWTLKLRFLCK